MIAAFAANGNPAARKPHIGRTAPIDIDGWDDDGFPGALPADEGMDDETPSGIFRKAFREVADRMMAEPSMFGYE